MSVSRSYDDQRDVIYERAWAALIALIEEHPQSTGKDVLALMPRVLRASEVVAAMERGGDAATRDRGN